MSFVLTFDHRHHVAPIDAAAPLPSFMEATAPLMKTFGDHVIAAIQHATAIKESAASSTSLNLDETAAVCLYIRLHSHLNDILSHCATVDDNKMIKPWIKYIRLLSEAINLLPNMSSSSSSPLLIYRCVNGDLGSMYNDVVGNVICWPTFTSCTSSIDSLMATAPPSSPPPSHHDDDDGDNKSDEYDNCDVQERKFKTIFVIQCHRAKCMAAFVGNEDSDEGLIMATTRFQVKEVKKIADDNLVMIHLDETQDIVEGFYPMMRRSELIDAVQDFKEQYIQSNLDNLVKMQQDLQQALELMKARMDRVSNQREQLRAESISLFEKYKADLDTMMAHQLEMIDNASNERSNWLNDRCIEITKTLSEIESTIKSSSKTAERSKDGEDSGIEVNAISSLITYKSVPTCVANATESMKHLQRWDGASVDIGKQEEDKDMIKVFRDEPVGKQLESAIKGLKMSIMRSECEEAPSIPVVIKPGKIEDRLLKDLARDTIKASTLVETNSSDIRCVCLISSSEVAVADIEAREVFIVSLETYKITRSFGGGTLSKPRGICLNHDGHILVADTSKQRVFLFDKDDGHLIKSSLDRFNMDPHGICCDTKTHRVFVADCSNNRIWILDENLTNIIDLKPLKGPTGVCMDSKGRLICCGSQGVTILKSDNFDLAKSFVQSERCGGVTTDGNDNIVVFVDYSSNIQIFDCSGNYIARTSLQDQFKCCGVCIDGNGGIIVSCMKKSPRAYHSDYVTTTKLSLFSF